MPKKLLIVRHAESRNAVHGLSDFDRPLNERGSADAQVMAKRLKDKQIIPQLLISSPALRAYTTAKFFAEVLGFKEEAIMQATAIYEASASTLLHIINSFDNKYDFIALFGHNPGVTNLSISLCDAGIHHIPAGGIVLTEFPFDDWKMISAGTGKIKLFDYPENTNKIL